MTADIDQLWPVVREKLTDEQILDLYAPPAPRWLRVNFISSLDGAATREQHSGGLGDAADRRVFQLLRRWADVVLVGAGTARSEGYGPVRLPEGAVRWRTMQGLTPQPVLALVTRRLDLDPTSRLFADAPVRPIIFTVASAPTEKRAALSAVADVIDTGDTTVDPIVLRDHLHDRGHTRIHSEGGPTLFGTFVVAGVVDELCLTLAPTLEAGTSVRITHDDRAAPTEMRLAGIMRSESELLLRYQRERLPGAARHG